MNQIEQRYPEMTKPSRITGDHPQVGLHQAAQGFFVLALLNLRRQLALVVSRERGET